METNVIKKLYGEGWALVCGGRKHLRYEIRIRGVDAADGVISAAAFILNAAKDAGKFTIVLQDGRTAEAAIKLFHDAFNADIEIEAIVANS